MDALTKWSGLIILLLFNIKKLILFFKGYCLAVFQGSRYLFILKKLNSNFKYSR
jgi:hypothetical protein